MGHLDEIEKIVLRNLIADNWDAFVAECEQLEGVNADDLYAKVGGEKDDH